MMIDPGFCAQVFFYKFTRTGLFGQINKLKFRPTKSLVCIETNINDFYYQFSIFATK
jgi:hypothetical protein